jgi:hypothetical protein
MYLYSIKWLVLAMGTKCIYCEVGTEFHYYLDEFRASKG